MLEDFLSFIGITEKKFCSVVDKFANREILEKRKGMWRLEPEVVKTLKRGGNLT